MSPAGQAVVPTRGAAPPSPLPLPPLLTATVRVGKYKLYQTIGEGAFGEVKVGVNEATGEEVAVKIMEKAKILEQELSVQVKREICCLKFISHRHVVRFIEVMHSSNKVYMVMELMRGGELFDLLTECGRMDEPMARKYFQQLVDGAHFCHQAGIVHRDLKPENLLLDENGDVKISDFGLSGYGFSTQLLKTNCGTPEYSAPEIINCDNEDGYDGSKVDVWSCGVILFCLLVGRLPFCDDQDQSRLFELISTCTVDYPPDLSAGAAAMLRRILVRDPSVRPSFADIKLDPWFRVDYDDCDLRTVDRSASCLVPQAASDAGAVGARWEERKFAGDMAITSVSTQADRPIAPRPMWIRREGPVARTASPPPDSILTMVRDCPGTPGPPREVLPARRVPEAVLMTAKPQPWCTSSADWARDALAAPDSPVEGVEGALVEFPSFFEEQPAKAPPFAALVNGAGGERFPAIAERMAKMLTDEADELVLDAYSSDGESVEDYESSPVPNLKLPTTGVFARHQAHELGLQNKQLHRRQISISVPPSTRHWSASHAQVQAKAREELSISTPFEQQELSQQLQRSAPVKPHRASSPLAECAKAMSPRLQPRACARESGSNECERESKEPLLRARRSQISRNVNQGGSPVTPASPLDERGSSRSAVRALIGSSVPWQGSKTEGEGSSSDISNRIWDLVKRWHDVTRVERDEPCPEVLELRVAHRSLQAEVLAIPVMSDKVAVLEQFMTLFGNDGFGDVASLEFWEGKDHDNSVCPLDTLPSLLHEGKAGLTLASPEPSPAKNDTFHRREIPTLPPKRLSKTSVRSGANGSRPSSASGPAESDDFGIPTDILEMQRMLQDSEHDGDNSAFEEEIDRLINLSPPNEFYADEEDGGARLCAGQDDGDADVDNAKLVRSSARTNGICAPAGVHSRSSTRMNRDTDFKVARVRGVPGLSPSLGPKLDTPVSPQLPGRRNGRKVEMASSMGLSDVEYYGHDRRGVQSKLKGVLTQMKQSKQRSHLVPENGTVFQSSQEPDVILFILSRILHRMGATVSLKKETRRKLRCSLPFPSGALLAAIELSLEDSGLTTVTFKRSRQDRARTDAAAFTNFFHLVHSHYVAEVQVRVPDSEPKHELFQPGGLNCHAAPVVERRGRADIIQSLRTMSDIG